jgi:hypothetical protein
MNEMLIISMLSIVAIWHSVILLNVDFWLKIFKKSKARGARSLKRNELKFICHGAIAVSVVGIIVILSLGGRSV